MDNILYLFDIFTIIDNINSTNIDIIYNLIKDYNFNYYGDNIEIKEMLNDFNQIKLHLKIDSSIKIKLHAIEMIKLYRTWSY